MKQHKANVDVSMGKFEPQTAKSTCLRINLEASFTPMIHSEMQPGYEQQSIYARELASPVLHIDKDYQNSWLAHIGGPPHYNQSVVYANKKHKLKKKSKKRKNPNTKRNTYNKINRSKSVNNNRKRLEKRINFYKVQNICNHFHRGSSGSRRREFNNTPVHKKSHSINEPISKGVAPVPSRTVRPAEILETKPDKLNTTKRIKTKRKNQLSMMDSHLKHNHIEFVKDPRKNMMNSNRIIEPFSPTFEHPEDFLPSNQTSFRPLAMAKYGMNLEKQYKRKV